VCLRAAGHSRDMNATNEVPSQVFGAHQQAKDHVDQITSELVRPHLVTDTQATEDPNGSLIRTLTLCERGDTTGSMVQISQRVSAFGHATWKIAIFDTSHRVASRHTFADTDLGRSKLLATALQHLHDPSNSNHHHKRMRALRDLASAQLQEQEQRLAQKRRVVDLLTAHDLKGHLKFQGVNVVKLSNFGGVAAIEEVTGFKSKDQMHDIVHDAIRDADMSFDQLRQADPMHVEGEDVIIFDATGDPDDVPRA